MLGFSRRVGRRANNGSTQTLKLFSHWQANQLTPTSLWQVFSRHEAVLNTHLDLLGSVKGHVAPDGEAFRTVSSMVNKTIQAMNQFKIVRKHMVCSCMDWSCVGMRLT